MFAPGEADGMRSNAHIDLSILESFFKVVVDGFIGDLADQGQVGDTNFLLLVCIKCGLLDIWFPS
jgi:hypothetical protein